MASDIMATERQIEANRRDDEKATGPRTEEGEGRSRRDAVVHGLAGLGTVHPEDEAAEVAARLRDWRDRYEVRDEDDRRAFEELVVQSVRLESCRRHMRVIRAYEAERAATTWAEDRAAEAEELGRGLSRRPGPVASRLRTTAAGVRWLVARWEGLAALDEWSDEQARLAFDLLGVPRELRDGDPWRGHASPRSLALAERDALAARLDALDRLDAQERACAERGTPVRVRRGAELGRLRRDEAACLRRLDQASLRLTPRPDPQATPSPPPPPTADVPPTPPSPRIERMEPRPERLDDPLTLAPVADPLPVPVFAAPRTLSHAAAPAVAAGPRPNRRARRAAERLARSRG